MTQTYYISGMSCGGCVARAKNSLLQVENITSADVQLKAPQATLTMQKQVPIAVLQNALRKAGYDITEADGGIHHAVAEKKAVL